MMMKKQYGSMTVSIIMVVAATATTIVMAFQTTTNPSRIQNRQATTTTDQTTKKFDHLLISLNQHNDDDDDDEVRNENPLSMMKKLTATAFMVASIWGTTSFTISTILPDALLPSSSTVAFAKEMASGSGSRVNKDPESLLRYGLPIQNKEVCVDYLIIITLLFVFVHVCL